MNTALPYQRHGAPKGRRRVLLLEEAEGEAETARRRRLQGTTSAPILRPFRDLILGRRVKPFSGGCRSTSTRSGASFRRRRMLPTRRSSPKVRQPKQPSFPSCPAILRCNNAQFRVLYCEFVLCVRPAIVLPEQSMASERTGMAVNKRGLTLRELLQQTGHYNANVRRGEFSLACMVTHWININ